jgi:hypothetical protein
MRMTAIAPEPCPFCRHPLDRVTAGPDNPDAVPQEGDITVCIQCGGLLVFKDDLKVRPPTAEEQAEIMADPQVIQMVTAITGIQIKARRGDNGQDA